MMLNQAGIVIVSLVIPEWNDLGERNFFMVNQSNAKSSLINFFTKFWFFPLFTYWSSGAPLFSYI
jgi:hypothetical protein